MKAPIKKFSLFAVIGLLLPLLLSGPVSLAADTVHKTYFENTDYELHVYEIRGYEPGNTIMLIGGIQGNEPGSYLAADPYADISLQKGSMIVVPRANFHAILLNQRGPNGDMNRKFALLPNRDTETRIVEILKELISRSDVLLNLHDGSGFYREERIDDLHNPMRYGQSIIADADVYQNPASGKVLRLGDFARNICKVVNEMIPEEEYKFRFNNHNTVSSESVHLEQRLSATYYSLTKHDIPAFGIESSKEIPSNEIKVRHKRMIINAFMNEFGIVPENPKILVEKPVLSHLIIVINGNERVALKDGETLLLNPGDRITLEHIDMNYSRGLAADIIGRGGINDLGKPFTINYPTRVIIRKDQFKCATVKLAFNKDRVVTGVSRVAELASKPPRLELLALVVDGRRVEVASGSTLDVPTGSVLEITEAVLDKPSYGKELQVNFKGFVGDKTFNTGEDRGYKIPIDRGLLERHSIDGQGKAYPIVVSCQGREIGRVIVRLIEQQAGAGN
jgi:Carboxypeptidase controlling helical cell shape catalytic